MIGQSFSKIKLGGLALLLIIGFAAGLFMIGYATSIGPWAFSDSTSYITAARNFASGNGLTVPDSNGIYSLLTWHPPLFPAILSLPIRLGFDAVQSARWSNALLFSFLAALAIWITWRFSRSLILSAGVGILILLTTSILRIFSGAMSEGIFLVCGFAGLYLLVEFLLAPTKRPLLIFAGILIGLAYLSRYTGIAFIGAGFFSLLILNHSGWKNRLANIAWYALSAGLLPAIWTVIVFLQTGTFGGRSGEITTPIPIGIRNYFQGFWETIVGWLPFINRGNQYIPALSKFIIGLALFAAAIIILVVLTRNQNKAAALRPIHFLSTTLVLFIFTYLLFHLASFLFSSAPPDVDSRLLSPVLIALYLGVPMLFASYSRLVKPGLFFNIAFLIASLITVWYFHQSVKTFFFEMHNYGEGYTSLQWKDEKVFTQIDQLAPGTTIYSNDPALVLFYTGKYPKLIEPNNLTANTITPTVNLSYLVIFYPQAESQLGISIQPWLDTRVSQFIPIYKNTVAGLYRWILN